MGCRAGRSRRVLASQPTIKRRGWAQRPLALAQDIGQRKLLKPKAIHCSEEPIALYSALYRDFEVTGVVDLAMGSGAAAIGSLFQQCGYIGLCYNGQHKVWVWRLIHQCFLTLVADGKSKVDLDIVKKAKEYFHRSVTAARTWLPSQEAKVLMVSGNHASDMDERTNKRPLALRKGKCFGQVATGCGRSKCPEEVARASAP